MTERKKKEKVFPPMETHAALNLFIEMYLVIDDKR